MGSSIIPTALFIFVVLAIFFSSDAPIELLQDIRNIYLEYRDSEYAQNPYLMNLVGVAVLLSIIFLYWRRHQILEKLWV